MRNTNPPVRNHLLVGAGTVAVILILGIVGMVVTGGDDEGVDADTSPLSPVPRAGRVIEHPTIGARIRKPRRWTHRRAGRSLTMRSPDRTVIMSVSLPPGTDRSARVLESGIAAVRRQYRRVRLIGTDKRRVAGLPTISVVSSAANNRGVNLRILTSAPQGRTRAWLVQVFSAARAKERRLAEAQVAIGTLRLTG
jgi:hypothetical protein